MVKVLVVSDEVDEGLTAERLREMSPGLVISCGDLPVDYLDFVSSAANAPLVYVPGNHDPDLRRDRINPFLNPKPPRPPGINLDGRIITERGLRLAGLGGSVRYREGPNQYTQARMRQRVKSLLRSSRLSSWGRIRRVDIFVSHAPPQGLGDEADPAHEGFDAFHLLIARLQPRYMVHGHIHPYGFHRPDRRVGPTEVLNVVPHRLLDVEAGRS